MRPQNNWFKRLCSQGQLRKDHTLAKSHGTKITISLHLAALNAASSSLEDHVGDRTLCSVCHIYLLAQLVPKISKECERAILTHGDACKADDHLDRGDRQQSRSNATIDDPVIRIECERETEEVLEDDHHCEGFDGQVACNTVS